MGLEKPIAMLYGVIDLFTLLSREFAVYYNTKRGFL